MKPEETPAFFHGKPEDWKGEEVDVPVDFTAAYAVEESPLSDEAFEATMQQLLGNVQTIPIVDTSEKSQEENSSWGQLLSSGLIIYQLYQTVQQLKNNNLNAFELLLHNLLQLKAPFISYQELPKGKGDNTNKPALQKYIKGQMDSFYSYHHKFNPQTLNKITYLLQDPAFHQSIGMDIPTDLPLPHKLVKWQIGIYDRLFYHHRVVFGGQRP